MKVLLIHCWGGNGRSCWSGWLADKLRERGVEVIAPDFPNTNYPKLDEWLAEVRTHIKKFDPKEEWVLIGHSLGCPTIFRLLETFEQKERIKAAILVAGFAKDLGFSETRNFMEKEFNWKKINEKCGKFVVINSDNDPYIELEEGERMAKLLNTELIVEHNAGHINEGSGFTKYEKLLGIITQLK